MDHVAYDYIDETGGLRYRVIRRGTGPGKAFLVEDPAGNELPDPIPEDLAILYRLPELIESPQGSTVYVVEGERDVETLHGFGLVATTNPCGTRFGWRPRFSRYLAGKHVVLLPDGDGPGRRHADAVRRAVEPVAASVITVTLYERGPWDVSDWLAKETSRRNINQLLRLVRRERLSHAGIDRDSPTTTDRESLLWSAGLPATQQVVLAYLAHRYGDPRKPSTVAGPITAAEIGKACGMHRVTAQNTIMALRRAGILNEEGIAWDIVAIGATPTKDPAVTGVRAMSQRPTSAQRRLAAAEKRLATRAYRAPKPETLEDGAMRRRRLSGKDRLAAKAAAMREAMREAIDENENLNHEVFGAALARHEAELRKGIPATAKQVDYLTDLVTELGDRWTETSYGADGIPVPDEAWLLGLSIADASALIGQLQQLLGITPRRR